MKVLLINPPFQRLKKIKSIYFPMGLGYLAGALSKMGFECAIYNAEVPKETLNRGISNRSLLDSHHDYIRALADERNPVWAEIMERLKEYKPDVVGISVMTPKYGSALKVSQLAKACNKECKVVWGGPHPTIEFRQVLAEESVDYAVRGEGEDTMAELCQAIRSGGYERLNTVRGLSYKKGGQVIDNPVRELAKDIDGFAFPARALVMQKELFPASAFGSLIASRGCPFECGYCSAYHTWGRSVRFRAVDRVIEEIKEVRAVYGTDEFYFFDDNFTLNKAYALRLCKAIKDNRLAISWNCLTRADLIDDELIKAMKSAGCRHIDIGIESGSRKVLIDINKRITLENIKKASMILKNNRMNWGAFLMFGFPDETEEDMKETLEFIKTLAPVSFEFSIFTPYPGTRLYELTRDRASLTQRPDWSHFSHQSPENYFSRCIGREQFDGYLRQFAEFVDSYNGSLATMARKTRNRGLFWLAHPALFSKKVISAVRKSRGAIPHA